MNITFGLLPPFETKVRKSDRKSKMAERSLDTLKNFANEMELI
jgi:folate-dependent tRNA-U54 methylase TrmFO/GidA